MKTKSYAFNAPLWARCCYSSSLKPLRGPASVASWASSSHWASAKAFAQVIKVPFNFNRQINVIAFPFSAAVGVLFGHTPAGRAARLNPIDALRRE